MSERPPSPPPPPELARAVELLIEGIARRIVELERELAPAAEPHAEQSPWLSLARAAAYLDWPRQRLYKLTAGGAIPHYKQEGRLLFRRDELDTWLSRFAQGDGR